VLYLLSLPLGLKSYRDQRRAYEAANAPTPAAGVAPSQSTSSFAPAVTDASQDDRPERLH
jgi:CDP-diacylglycerol---serine O-phosphatidyltransferase